MTTARTPSTPTATAATEATSATGTARPVRPTRPVGPLVAAAGALAAAAIASLLLGAQALDTATVLSALRGGADEVSTGIVTTRIDRTLVAIVVGAACGTAGVLLQGVTRNPLADPGLLGLGSGGALAVVVGIRFLGVGSPAGYAACALVGVLAAGAVVAAAGALAPASERGVTTALVGAAVMATSTSLLGALLLTARETLAVFRFWQVGSVAGRDAGAVAALAPLVAAGLLGAFASARALDEAALGDDLARGLGGRLRLERTLAVLAAVGLVAAATALAGPIAFVGLVVPHVGRLLLGPGHAGLLRFALVAGPLLLLVADVLGRVVAPPAEIAAGIGCAVLGAPVLLLLVRRGAPR